MAAGTVTINISIPDTLVGSANGDATARILATTLFAQLAVAIGHKSRTSGSVAYPRNPSQGAQATGTWSYTPPA
jgi:hypothetical protein